MERGQADDAAAARTYEVLVAGHPEAYADHAAAFYLAAGSDPARALQLARLNLASTPPAPAAWWRTRPLRCAATLVPNRRRDAVGVTAPMDGDRAPSPIVTPLHRARGCGLILALVVLNVSLWR